MSDLNDYNWNKVPGKDRRRKLRLLGLTTCGKCRQAEQWLEAGGYAFEHIEVDTLPADEKREFKRSFRAEYGQRLLFPTLLVSSDEGDDEVLVYFVEPHWNLVLA